MVGGKFMPPTIQKSVKFRDFAHAFNASPYNLASFLILRHSFQQRQRIFTNRRCASPRMTRHIRELQAHSECQIWNDDQRTEAKTKK